MKGNGVMGILRRHVAAILLLCTAAIAASGIEVLSQTEVGDGIEVLCTTDGGATLEAWTLVGDDWIVVNAAPADGGLAAVVFPGLAAGEARLVLRDASGGVVDVLAYAGGGRWRDAAP